MNIKSTFFTLIFCISVRLSTNSEIFIDYGVEGQGKQLYKYFHNINDGFYVDLGAYDPIFASSTLNLYVQGWKGINVQPNPQRLSKFFLERPYEINLNVAVGEKDQFVTLYELNEDGTSTISQKVKDFVKGFKTVEKEIKVPTLTLKQICQRFFYRKPIFMNIDVAGYGSRILETNDWNNQKCISDVIFSELSEETKQSGFTLPQSILSRNGYQKVGLLGVKEVYVHNSVVIELKKKYDESAEKVNKMNIVLPYQVTSIIGQYLNVNASVVKHYEPQKAKLVYYFTKANEPVELQKISRESNTLSPQQPNRPIIILHFDPRSNYLLLENSQFIMHKLQLGPFQFWELNITLHREQMIRVLILDHLFQPATEVTIVSLTEETLQLEQKKVYIPHLTEALMLIQQQKEHEKQVIEKFSSELLKNEQQFSKVGQKCSAELTSLQTILSTNKKTETSLLGTIADKLKQIEQKIQYELQEEQKEKRLQTPASLQISLLNFQSFQLITLATAALMGSVLCISICVKKQKQYLQRIKIQRMQTEQEQTQMQ